MGRGHTLRNHWRVVALVSGCVLPMWVFVGYLSYTSFDAGRQDLEQALSSAAQLQLHSVEREVAVMEASLRALASSPSLDRHDYGDFYLQANEVMQNSFGSNIVLHAVTGEQIINTSRPFGQTLPTDPPPYLARLMETRQPVLSDLYRGQVSGNAIVSLAVPVIRQGRVLAILTMALDTKHLIQFIRQEGYPSSWVGAMLDSTGTIVARIREPEKYVGQKPAPAVLEAVRSASHGVVAITSLEGSKILAGYRRSELYGWTFIVAVPREILEEKLKHSLLLSLGGSSALFLFTLLSAWLLWRSFIAAENAGERNHLLLQHASDGIHILDPTGNVIEASESFCRMLGYSRAEVIGMNAGQWDAEFTADELAKAIARQFECHELSVFETRHRRKDGSVFDVEVTGYPLTLDGQPALFNSARDITERKKAEHEQIYLNRALRLLSDCNMTIMLAENEQTLLADVCRLVVEIGGYLMAWIGVPQDDTDKSIRPVAQFGDHGLILKDLLVSWDEARDIGRGPTGTAIRTGTTQINQDYLTNPNLEPWRETAVRNGFKASISLPLIIRELPVGALTVYAGESGAFNREEAALLEELARNLSFGIETQRTRRQHEAAQAELAVAATAFNSQEGMVVTDRHGIILRINRAFAEMTGYPAKEVVGKTPRILRSDRHDEEFYRLLWTNLARSGLWQGEIWNRRKNGDEYIAWLTISAVKDSSGAVTNFVGTQFDITDRKKAEAKINELAFFDQLTGLPNRTLFIDRLKQAMTASSRSRSYGALLFIDLDDFKTLNETLGHEMGDLLLQQVTRRLGDCVRDEDTVARFGGDEFLLMLVNLGTSETQAATQVEQISEKIRTTLNQPYPLGNAPYHCTPSIGVTLFKGHTVAIEDLLKQADLAMYRSKAAGRNAIRFFDSGMETAVMGRAALARDLRLAVEQQQFVLHYQPQVVGSGRVTGAEALVRWQHPQRGMVTPAEFIPLAEETGLILPLGDWVLETACRQLAVWANQPKFADVTMAVNVSARQYRQTDFVDRVLGIIKNTGANPRRLKLELTESLLVENVQDIIEKMFALKAKGVGFSLDDFGTGYSSLSYLKRLPLDQLKIDQSFVRDVLTDPSDAAIARTIVTLAQSLTLGVIAEGVETTAQLDFLASSGCHAYQGFLFSRPLELKNFEDFLLKNL